MSSSGEDTFSLLLRNRRYRSKPDGSVGKPFPQYAGMTLAILLGLAMAALMARSTTMALLLLAAICSIIIAAKPWRGLVLLLIASQFNGLRFDYGAFTIRPDQFVFVIVLAVLLVLFVMGRIRIYRTALDVPILILLLTGLISSLIHSPDQAYSLQGLLLQSVYAGMYFATVTILLNYRSRIDDIVKAFMVIAIIHAAYALLAFISFIAGVQIGGISSAHFQALNIPSTSGLFQEANLYAAFAASAVAMFAAHLLSNEETGIMKRKYLVAGTILLLTVVATSMTRSVWVGLLLVLAILPFYSKPRRNVINPKALAVIAALVVSLGLFIFPLLNYAFSLASGNPDALYSRMEALVDFSSGSGAGRLDIQEEAIDRWDEQPYIGHGVLSLEEREGTFSRAWLYSSFFQSLFDTGIVGASMIILIHVIPIFLALIAARASSNASRRATLIGFALGAFVISIASQASSFLWLGYPWVYFGILVATAKSTTQSREQGNRIISGRTI